jgi:hypothetical protein
MLTEKQYKTLKFLNADKPLHNKMLALKMQLEEYNTLVDVGAINYENDGSTPSKNGNSIERKFNKYIDETEKLKSEIADVMEKLTVSIKRKKELIDTLEDSRLYAVASMLFISYMTYEQIAEVMGFECTKTVQRDKIKILNKLGNVLECPPK